MAKKRMINKIITEGGEKIAKEAGEEVVGKYGKDAALDLVLDLITANGSKNIKYADKKAYRELFKELGYSRKNAKGISVFGLEKGFDDDKIIEMAEKFNEINGQYGKSDPRILRNEIIKSRKAADSASSAIPDPSPAGVPEPDIQKAAEKAAAEKAAAEKLAAEKRATSERIAAEEAAGRRKAEYEAFSGEMKGKPKSITGYAQRRQYENLFDGEGNLKEGAEDWFNSMEINTEGMTNEQMADKARSYIKGMGKKDVSLGDYMGYYKAPQAAVGIGTSAWLVNSLAMNKGQQSNAQLYGYGQQGY